MDCLKCKRWTDCIGKAHFEFNEIRYCPHQVMWILEHSDTLLDGDWPTDPDGNTETDHVQKGYNSEASFVKPEVTLADVEFRLKTTGPSGEALRDAAQKGYLIDDLSPPAWRALMYVKGFYRKKQTFSQWIRGIR